MKKHVLKKKTKSQIQRKINKQQEKELLKLWGMAVFALYGNTCICCHKPANQPHHIFARHAYPAVKFDIDNGVPLCNSCHYKLHFTEQNNEIIDAIRNWLGKKKYNRLKEKAHGMKLRPDQYEDKKEELMKIIYGEENVLTNDDFIKYKY